MQNQTTYSDHKIEHRVYNIKSMFVSPNGDTMMMMMIMNSERVAVK